MSAVNRLYLVATWVPRRETIAVGALGPVTFARGWYAYVGSARRGRNARVARHQCAAKPLRWQADYLFSGHPATRSWLLDTPLSECELAARLCAAGSLEREVARFGASDCGCAGHLLYAARLGALQAAVRAVDGRRATGVRPASSERPPAGRVPA